MCILNRECRLVMLMLWLLLLAWFADVYWPKQADDATDIRGDCEYYVFTAHMYVFVGIRIAITYD